MNVKPKCYDELKKGFYKRRLKAIFDEELSKRKHRPDENILSYITSIKSICHDLEKK